MARILDVASVRIEVDIRRGERDARNAGEIYGQSYVRGVQRGVDRDPITPRGNPLDAEFERQLRAQLRKITAGLSAEIPLTARGEEFRRQVATQIAAIERSARANIPVDPEEAAAFRRKLATQVREVSRSVRAEIGVDVDRGALGRVGGAVQAITKGLSQVTGLGGKAGRSFADLASTGSGMGRVLGGVFGDAVDGATKFGGSLSGVGKIAGRVGPGLIMIVGSIAQAVLKWYNQMAPVAAVWGLVAGAATAAMGAVTAAVAGLPVVLTTLIAPIAAVALGMDGITRAAQTLSPEIAALRAALSTVLEHEFAIVFERLRPVFPVLQHGLMGVAVSVGHFARDLANVATSADGLRDVESAIRGSGVALDIVSPSAAELLKQFLAIAGTEPLYRVLGETVAGVIDRFSGFLQKIRESGVLTRALERLRDVLFSASDAVFALAEGSAEFFVGAGPGIAEFFDGLAVALGNIDWERFGAAFGRIMGAIGDGLERIPPETFNRLAESVEGFADSVRSFVDSGALNVLVGGFATLISHAGTMLDVLTVLVTPVESLLESLGFLGKETQSAGEDLEALNQRTAETGDGFSGLRTKIDEFIDGIPVRFEGMNTGIEEQLTRLDEDFTSTMSELPVKTDEFLSQLPDKAGYWMGYLSTTIGLKAKEGYDQLVSWFGQMPGQVEQASSDLVTRAKSWFDQLGPLLGAATDAASERVRGGFERMKTQAGSLAAGTRDDVSRFLHELPGRLGDLKDALFRVGGDMIRGFIDGIKSAAGAVVQAARDVVSGAVRGAQDALKTGSPSKVFASLGRDTMAGYLIGLRERLAPMIAEVRAMFAQATQSASDAIRSGATGLRPIATGNDDVDRVLGSFTSRSDPAELVSALSGLRFTARFDGPNVVELVADEGRRLTRR
ncbi:MAG: phage tail protein [Pseudonocardiaceae bacterium]